MSGNNDTLPKDLWVVIAAYNEEPRIGGALDDLLGHASNIVVVNDGSTDDTGQVALERPVYLLEHLVNLGQGAALQTGITFALLNGASHIVTFDADGQHDPADLPPMFRALEAQAADFALGSRFLGRAEGIPLRRRVTLRLGILFTWLVSGVRLSDTHNGIRLMTRRGAQHLRITLNRMEHASQIVDQIVGSGLKYVELPVTVRYRAETLAKGQKSTAAIRIGIEVLLEKISS